MDWTLCGTTCLEQRGKSLPPRASSSSHPFSARPTATGNRRAPESSRSEPRDAGSALEYARFHALRAAAEALTALRYCLDAVCLAATGTACEDHTGWKQLAAWLDSLAAVAEQGDTPGVSDALATVAEALALEIHRWEQRAGSDPEARAVLRALLGLREILWELGVRGRNQSAAGTPVETGAAPRPSARRTRSPNPASAAG